MSKQKRKIHTNQEKLHYDLSEIIDGLVQLDDHLLEVLSGYHYHQTAVHELMTNGLEENKSLQLFGHMLTTHWLAAKGKRVLDEVEKLTELAASLEK